MKMYPEEFDSVFRYIIVVSQRAEQLMMGAKPRIETRHTKPTMIAKEEVDKGLISWHILTPEEIEAQRHALVEQYRSEVGAETAEATAQPIPDVLPTAPAKEPELEEPGEKDEEVARLSKLLGLAGISLEGEDAASEEPGEDAGLADEPAGEPDEEAAGDLPDES